MTPRCVVGAAAITMIALCHPVRADGQACVLPDSVRALVPPAPSSTGAYTVLWRGESSLEGNLGLGHLHYAGGGQASERPPGDNDWLRSVELPLSDSPGSAPWGWIAGGWLLRGDSSPEPLESEALIETGYEQPSFIVLEENSDGWLRIRYASVEGAGAAWTPSCALQSSPAVLRFIRWSDWFLGGEISPLFFRSEAPRALLSDPSVGSLPLTEISGDYVLEPLEVRGAWMRVALKRPSDYCVFDAESTSTEGWVRWYSEEEGPLVWYFTRGC